MNWKDKRECVSPVDGHIDTAIENQSICRSCFHSYVCEQFNENRRITDNKKCHFYNDHFVAAADMVEVVRCEKCVHCDLFYPCKAIDEEEPMPAYYCKIFRQYRKPTDFCSYGELKESEKVCPITN